VTLPANSSTGKLLLTHKEWLERSKQDGGRGGSSSSEKRDHKNRHGKDTCPGLKKLEDRSCTMIFVGYEHGSKAYRFYNPSTKRVVISRDVVFDEAGVWKWAEEDGVATGLQSTDVFTVEYTEEYLRQQPRTGPRRHANCPWLQRPHRPQLQCLQ
jgi:hypothetical protein